MLGFRSERNKEVATIVWGALEAGDIIVPSNSRSF